MTETKLAPWDKILPTQQINSALFNDPQPFAKAIYEAVLDVSGLKAPDEQFKLETSEMFTIEEMASNPVTLSLLQWLIYLFGARNVIEIGAFIGVSTLYFAQAVPDNGRVLTIEKFAHFAEIARRNFVANGLAHKIHLMLGDAHDLIPSLSEQHQSFDLAFIDGNKERYADYFHMLEPLVRPGGVIAVDDAFFHGEAVNRMPRSAKGKGVRLMLDVASRLNGWKRVLLPISNGMLLLLKPR
jgi:caffeoyl-CoA O-methyltransferase